MIMWYKIAFLLSYYFFYCDRTEKQILFIFICVLHDSDNWKILHMFEIMVFYQFSAANLALAGFPLTNALGENVPPHH